MNNKKSVAKLGLVLVSLVAAVGFGAVAVAGSEECQQECSREFAADRAACAAAYNEAAANANAAYQECIAGATSLFDRLVCSSERRRAIDRAGLERKICENRSDTEFARCFFDCATSPSAP